MHVRSLYRIAFLQSFVESAEHSRLRDVPKISRKHFSENSSVRTTSDAQTSWAHEGRVVFCSIFSGIFFVQARVSTCAHLNEGHGKMPRRPDGEIVPACGSLGISQGRVLYWPLLELAGDEAFIHSFSGRRHSYVSRLVESDTSHIQPPRFAGLPRAQ